MNNDVMKAILSMDSYNRGYSEGINLGVQVGVTQVGYAVVIQQSNILTTSPERQASFYAIAYNYNSEKVIAFRGTDSLSGDAATGYGVGAGNPKEPQAQMAFDFYKAVSGGGDPRLANISLTGHSLGGGLAGLVGAVYGKSGVLFDNMAFEDAAQNTKLFSEPSSGSLYNEAFKTKVYGALVPWQPTISSDATSKLQTWYVNGEFLSNPVIAGNHSGQTTPQHDLDMGPGVELPQFWDSGLFGDGKHSIASLVILLYADASTGMGIGDSWKNAAQYFWPVLYNDDFAERLVTETDIQGTLVTDEKYSVVLRTALAYSAIDEGARIFGDTAIKALYDDATDFGYALSEGHSKALDLVGSEIAKSFAEFSGYLALNKIEQEVSANAQNGILTYSGTAGSHLLTINFDPLHWKNTLKDEYPQILSKRELLEALYASTAFGKDLSGSAMTSIAFIVESSGSVTLPNNASQQLLVVGSEGSDVINMMSGNIDIMGREGNDTFIINRLGRFNIDGGEGIDILDFSNYEKSVSVTTGTSFNGSNGFGKALNVENIIGSAYDDYFTINNQLSSMYINGANGNDTLYYNMSVSIIDYRQNIIVRSNEVIDRFENIENIIPDFSVINGSNIIMNDGGFYKNTGNGKYIYYYIDGNVTIDMKSYASYVGLYDKDSIRLVGINIENVTYQDQGINRTYFIPGKGKILIIDYFSSLLIDSVESKDYYADHYIINSSDNTSILNNNNDRWFIEYNEKSIFDKGGNDTYYIKSNTGTVIIDDYNGVDRVVFDPSLGINEIYAQNDYIYNNGNRIVNIDDIESVQLSSGSIILKTDIMQHIYGSNGSDELNLRTDYKGVEAHALAGNDTIVGLNGLNIIYGEDGNDIITGGGYDDFLYGGSGNDVFYGTHGADYIDGGDGYDVVDYGNNVIYGVDYVRGLISKGSLKDYLVSIEEVRGNVIAKHGDFRNTVYTYDHSKTLYIYDDGGNDSIQLDYYNSFETTTFRQDGGDLHIYSDAGAIIILAYFDPLNVSRVENISIEDGKFSLDLNHYLNWSRSEGGQLNGDNNNAKNVNKADTLIGSAEIDIVHGWDLDDKIYLGASDDLGYGDDGNDYIHGAEGRDIVFGGNGNDFLWGGDGDDILVGEAGGDVLNGGEGFDTASYETSVSGVTIDLTTGVAIGGHAQGDQLISIEHVIGSSYNDVINSSSNNESITWSTGLDNISDVGGAADALILPGDKTLPDFKFIADGNDLIISSIAGGHQTKLLGQLVYNGVSKIEYLVLADGTRLELKNYALWGQQGNTINGTSGNNNLSGTAGDDNIYGMGGNDTIYGGAGNDLMDGGAGTDTLTYNGGSTGVTVNLSITTAQNTGGAGIDTIMAFENLTGTYANDTLTGDAGNNVINGGNGWDVIEGGLGDDTLIGGGGTDTLSYANAASRVAVSLAITSAQNTLGAGTDTVSQFENLTGSVFSDSLTGDAAANTINGRDGDDIIQGGLGNDTLNGGGGIDTVSYADAAAAVAVSLAITSSQNTAGAGYDTLSEFENLTGSAFNDMLTGNGGDNILNGGAGNDTLNGLGGADSLQGGLGDDIYVFAAGSGADRIIEAGGVDKIQVAGFLPEHLLFSTVGNDLVITSALSGADSITLAGQLGADANARVESLVFADGFTLSLANYPQWKFGNGDKNTLYGDQGAGNIVDVLFGRANDDTMKGYGNNDVLSGDAGADRIWGGNGNDLIHGGSGNDTLYGEAGNDTLYGGTGADTLSGGAGADRFMFDPATDAVDTITDFSASEDVLDLSAMLTQFDPLTQAITDFVQITDSGANSILKVDKDGAANGQIWTQVATLTGVTGLTDEASLMSAGRLEA